MFSNNKSSSQGAKAETGGAVDCTDPRDFRRVYDGAMELMFKISYKITGDKEAAEDLAHDSFIKAYEHAMVFPSLDDAKFWLIRVVKNASLNYAKRKGREAKAYHKALYENTGALRSGEDAFLRKEARRTVTAALDMLPANLKEVLILKEYGGMNYKEIGRVLGITEGNVKVRVFRAKKALLKLIGEDNV